MNEAIRQVHNTAMELSDLARIKRAKEGDEVFYNNYMNAAFELELYAAMKTTEAKDENDRLWQVTLFRSAGWLAFNCGYYDQALSLAETGLGISSDPYTTSKLKELKKAVKDKTASLKGPQPAPHSIKGLVFSADIESNTISIKHKNGKHFFTINVPEKRMQHIARLFLGSIVEIQATKNEKGVFILEEIKWAA